MLSSSMTSELLCLARISFYIKMGCFPFTRPTHSGLCFLSCFIPNPDLLPFFSSSLLFHSSLQWGWSIR